MQATYLCKTRLVSEVEEAADAILAGVEVEELNESKTIPRNQYAQG